jgi:hypothetical protein
MSIDMQPTTPTFPAKPRRRWPWIVTALAALIIGIAIGSTGESTETTTDTSPPASVVTVADVPDVCLQALDNAEDLMGFSADFAGIAAEMPMMIYDGIEAGMDYDAAAIEDLTDKLNGITADVEELTEQIGSSDYRDNADQCRDSAGSS